jgi:hypothetical protein
MILTMGSCNSWAPRDAVELVTCHILLTYHGNYLEKLRKIVILVHFLYFHDDVIMTYHDHNKNQSSTGIKKKCHV